MPTASTHTAAVNLRAREPLLHAGVTVSVAAHQSPEYQLFLTSTAEQAAAVQQLQTHCPALLNLRRNPVLAPLDPLQALALHDLLTERLVPLKVLEIGHGPWAPVLALLTHHQGGRFWSTGIDAWRTRRLAQQLDDARVDGTTHLLTTRLASVETLGMKGEFPNLDPLGDETDFNLIFISAGEAVRDAASVLHAVPMVASRVAMDGFTLCVSGGSNAMQAVAAATWGYLVDEFEFTPRGCAGLGLIVKAH